MIEGIFLGLYVIGLVVFNIIAFSDERVSYSRKLTISISLISLVWPIAVVVYYLNKD